MTDCTAFTCGTMSGIRTSQPPATRTHGIYSFRDVIRCKEEYGYSFGESGPLLFGKVKIWGEIVEHETGYRSQFGKIASIDYGDPVLVAKFRKIYRVNQISVTDSKPET